MKQKAAIFLADGFEEVEGLMVVDLLRRAGLEITMVSIEDTITITSAHQVKIEADTILETISLCEFDLFILPGGLQGTNRLGQHKELMNQIKEQYKAGKRIAAICAAPSLFGINGLLEGKKATCYPGFEDKLLGATIVEDKVITDGMITTGKGLGVATDFALELIMLLKGKEAARQIAASIQYSI